ADHRAAELDVAESARIAVWSRTRHRVGHYLAGLVVDWPAAASGAIQSDDSRRLCRRLRCSAVATELLVWNDARVAGRRSAGGRRFVSDAMSQDIVIVDYGMATLRSVQKALEHIGHAAAISSDPDRAARCDKLILPGVGAFRDGIARLRESGLTGPIFDHVRSGRPLLGICLGLQFLFTRSHEDGQYEGLDIFSGDVVRFPNFEGLKVPHMGWNELRMNSKCPLFRGLKNGDAVYFVHSYFAQPAA